MTDPYVPLSAHLRGVPSWAIMGHVPQAGVGLGQASDEGIEKGTPSLLDGREEKKPQHQLNQLDYDLSVNQFL
jgi:hypothetical protein